MPPLKESKFQRILKNNAVVGTANQIPTKSSLKFGLFVVSVAWIISKSVISITYAPARSLFSFNPMDWARWDSVNYLSITIRGRTFGLCSEPPFSSLPNPLGVKYCGTAGWLPGYPWVMRIAHSAGLSLDYSGLIISWLAMFLAMFLIWLGWGRDLKVNESLSMLVMFGIFPGSVYNFALFPTSLALVFLILALLFFSRDAPKLSAVFLTCAGLCYPSAWFASIGLSITFAISSFKSSQDLSKIKSLGYVFIGILPLAVVGLLDTPWNAFWLMDHQDKVNAKGLPGAEFVHLIVWRDTVAQQLLDPLAANLLAIQSLIVVAIVVLGLWSYFRETDFSTSGLRNFMPIISGVAVASGVILLNANGGAWNRSVVLAAPCVVGIRRRSWWLRGLLICIMVFVTSLISNRFFTGTLI